MENNRKMNNTGRARSQNIHPTIGFLTAQILDTNGMDLWFGVADAAQERGVNLLCFLGNELQIPVGFQAQANVLYDLVSAESLDGLVVWGSALSNFVGIEALQHFYERFRPLPIVNVALPVQGVHNVLIDSYQGMRMAILHLLEIHGYRRIAFVRGPADNQEANERYRAYTDLLREYGIPFAPNLVALAEYWLPPSGAKAMRKLLEQSGGDFEAVVAASDDLAIDGIAELQAYGKRIPGDVALVGFDNSLNSRYVTPPLTTMPLLNYDQGYRAVEMVLELLAGQDVPEQVVISGNLLIRQSCGCMAPELIQAAIQPGQPAQQQIETVLIEQRERLMTDMVQAVGVSQEHVHDVAQLVDTFAAEITGRARDTFLATLDYMLGQVAARGGSVTVWQNALSVLRRYVFPYLKDDTVLSRAETLCQQARVLIGMIAERAKAQQWRHAEQQADVLREINQALIITFDVPELMNILAQELPRLGIPGCYLALYENPDAPTECSRLILAYNQQGRMVLKSGGQRFPSRELAPDRMLRREKPSSMFHSNNS
jgi:DNA-binding LacI/PurR family transcriptional regulator